MSRRAKWTMLFTIVAVVGGGLFALTAAKRGSRATEVRLEPVSARDLVAAVTASGKIEAKTTVDISADITGPIPEIAVQAGERGHEGRCPGQIGPAHAALAEARSSLAKTHLVSPIDGRVVRLAVEKGEVAVPGTFSRETGLLMTIADLSVVLAKVQVDETDVVRLHLGDSVSVSIDAFPDTAFVGRVTKISNSAKLSQTGAASGSSTDR